MSLNFTGEYWIPGQVSRRIEADHRERYRFAAHYVKSRHVLDVACGVGYGAKMLLEAGASSVHGVDILPELIEHARASYGGERLSFSSGDLCTLTDLGPFDVVTCFETIEHVADHHRALANIHRVLKPGGVLLISSPNRAVTSPCASSLEDKPDNQFHVREFLVLELTAALETHGFKVFPAGVFGQRLRPRMSNPTMARVYRKLFRPDVWGSPVPKPVGSRIPRYFIILARKG